MYDALIELPIREKEWKEFEGFFIDFKHAAIAGLNHAKFVGLDTHAGRDKSAYAEV